MNDLAIDEELRFTETTLPVDLVISTATFNAYIYYEIDRPNRHFIRKVHSINTVVF